jgi:hypothetical protein
MFIFYFIRTVPFTESSSVGIVLGIVIPLIAMLLIAIGYYFYKNKNKSSETTAKPVSQLAGKDALLS